MSASAPTQLTPVSPDQAIGNTVDGHQVMPAVWFIQMLQRLLAFIGQPTGSSVNGTSNPTISEQISELINAVETLQGSIGAPSPGIDGRVASLEGTIVRLLARPTMPVAPRFFSIPATPPVPADTAPAVIYGPLTNGDLPGSILIGYPDGQIKGPTIVSDAIGQVILVQVQA